MLRKTLTQFFLSFITTVLIAKKLSTISVELGLYQAWLNVYTRILEYTRTR